MRIPNQSLHLNQNQYRSYFQNQRPDLAPSACCLGFGYYPMGLTGSADWLTCPSCPSCSAVPPGQLPSLPINAKSAKVHPPTRITTLIVSHTSSTPSAVTKSTPIPKATWITTNSSTSFCLLLLCLGSALDIWTLIPLMIKSSPQRDWATYKK